MVLREQHLYCHGGGVQVIVSQPAKRCAAREVIVLRGG
jgi:hypothetical protein